MIYDPNRNKTANVLEREPVLLAAPAIGALTDLLSGTGTNSHVAALVAAVGVALLRFIVTSPATAKLLRQRAATKAP